MEKLVLVIKDVVLNTALMSLSEGLGLSVDQCNYERSIGEAVSIGTSKKYIVAGNSEPSYYKSSKTKFDVNIIDLDLKGFMVASKMLLEKAGYSYESTPVKTSVHIQAEVVVLPIDLHKSGVEINTIFSLYAKVKKQKKSPANYFVKIKEDGTVVVTNDKKGSLGNLKKMFDEIN